MSKTLDLFNKIIAESEENKQDKKTKNNKKVVDGAEGKPAVIQEDDELITHYFYLTYGKNVRLPKVFTRLVILSSAEKRQLL